MGAGDSSSPFVTVERLDFLPGMAALLGCIVARLLRFDVGVCLCWLIGLLQTTQEPFDKLALRYSWDAVRRSVQGDGERESFAGGDA